jgi:hypothetical protein
MKVKVTLLLSVLLTFLAVPTWAAPRDIVIEVRDDAGRPVAQARVLIAADELDAVGLTDADGRVTLRTQSSQVQINVDKDGRQAELRSNAERVVVRLAGGAR